jgi:hypothetical protein
LPITSLKMNLANPRQHSQRQIINIARNIDQVGFVVPCIIDDENHVLAGNARIEAATELGMTTVPVVRLRHLNELEQRAFIIADNRLPELASWNEVLLRQELSLLNDLDIDFDFSAIGFETAEVDSILDGGTESDDRAEALQASIPTTRYRWWATFGSLVGIAFIAAPRLSDQRTMLCLPVSPLP